MIFGLVIAAALTTQQPLRFELINKPGRVPYDKFELQLRVTNISDHAVEVGNSLVSEAGGTWDFRDLKGKNVTGEFERGYIDRGPLWLSPLGPGKSRSGHDTWQDRFNDASHKMRITFQETYRALPPLGSKPGDPRVVDGLFPSNKLVLEVGPGYVDVIRNDLHKPKE